MKPFFSNLVRFRDRGKGGFNKQPERLFGIVIQGGAGDHKTERLDQSFRFQARGEVHGVSEKKKKTLSEKC